MKRFLKLFPAALAVFALASCNEIDTPEQKTVNMASAKGDLVVDVEPFDDAVATRALLDADANLSSLTFQTGGDAFKVYDDELYKYDVYKFNTDAFYLQTKPAILQTPKYGLFPGDMIVRGYYDREKGLTKGEFAIPETIVYNAESEQKVGNKTLYAANLPMFGLASLNGEKVYVSKMRYLCGVLKLNLKDVYGNATWLRLSSTKKNLSGTFVAVLDASTEEARKGVKLEESSVGDLIVNDHIYIDLRNIPSRNSVIYIPVIPGIDANADGLQLDYTAEDKDAGSKVSVSGWTNTGLKFPKEVIKQHKVYPAEWEFSLTDMNPYKVTDMLDQYKETESPIQFDLADKFTIDKSVETVSNVIKVPALNEGVDVTINLGKQFGKGAGDGWINATPDRLEIVDADDADPFTGTFTLNVSDILTAASTKAATDILVRLPQAKVKVIGDLSDFSTKKIYLAAADEVTFGDGKTTTVINPTNFYLGTVNTITIAEKATVTGDLKSDNYSSSFPTPVGAVINVAGKLVGNIDFAKNYNAQLNVTSKLATADEKAIDGAVDFGGDVEIALPNEGEAISGTLKMRGAKSELTIKQGYINTIEVDLENAGSWESKYINVNLDQPISTTTDAKTGAVTINYGKTAFLTLTETDGVAKFTKSVWGGAKITNTTYDGKRTTAYGNDKNIFTASQFASQADVNGVLRLANNIDLNDKAWNGITKSGLFEGLKVVEKGVAEEDYAYPTVENLNLTVNGGGLFKTCTAPSEVKNISISGVKAAPTAKSVAGTGALYGTASGALTVENVAVTDINIIATAPTTGANAGVIPELSNVGGVVGSTTAALTLKKVSTAGSITGYSYLGGFVGKAAAAVTAGTATDGTTRCSSTVTLAANFDSKKTMDMNYARMGGYVGSVISDANVTIADGSTCTSNISGKNGVMFLSDTSAGVGNFFDYTQDQKFIGFSGTYQHASGDYKKTYGTIKINSTTLTYVEPFFGTADKYQGDNTKTIGSTGGAWTSLRVLYHFTQQQ